MGDTLLFFKKFLQQGASIASFVPSSRALAEKAIAPIDWSRADIILELGAGTGPVTYLLAERAPASCRVLVLEREPDFAEILRRRFAPAKNIEIIEADADKLAEVLRERGVRRIPYIVSGLPVPSFTEEARTKFFDTLAQFLGEDGIYTQITVIPLLYRRVYKKYFGEVTFHLVLRNFPPAGVYVCRKLRSRR